MKEKLGGGLGSRFLRLNGEEYLRIQYNNPERIRYSRITVEQSKASDRKEFADPRITIQSE